MCRWLLVLTLLAGCRGDLEATAASCHRGSDLFPPTIIPDAGPADGGATARATSDDPAGCSQFVASPVPPSTAWVDAQAATGTCADPSPVAEDVCAAAGEMYAACEGQLWVPDVCVLEPGMQYCRYQLWTVLCDQDDQCPQGFACDDHNLDQLVGSCQRRCVIDADCGACSLACSVGLCQPRPQDPPPGPV